MAVNRRIRELEDKVLMTPKPGTTRFSPSDLPENEQLLLEQGRKIAVNVPFGEATEEQKIILDEAGKLLTFRIFDLFTTYLEGWFCQDDKIARIVLHERMLWFITELMKEMKQQIDVSEIERNTPEDCEVDRVDEYFRKAPELYTHESYEKIGTNFLLEQLKKNPNYPYPPKKKKKRKTKKLDNNVQKRGTP